MRYYELWSNDTANLAADGETEAELLRYVRDMIAVYGEDVASAWGLLWADDEDETAGGLIAEGKDLIEMAVRPTGVIVRQYIPTLVNNKFADITERASHLVLPRRTTKLSVTSGI